MVMVQDPGGEVRGGKGRARNMVERGTMERDNGKGQWIAMGQSSFNFFLGGHKKGESPFSDSWNKPSS
jgi:hypothetical protein